MKKILDFAEDRLISANNGQPFGLSTYWYDGEGRRVKKEVGSVVTIFVYDVAGRMVAEYSTAAPTQNGTQYLTTDNLGTPRLVTGADGSVRSRHDYHPYGEEISNQLGDRSNVPGYGGSDNLRQKFTGYERDEQTELDYAQARYYSSAQGRFTSVDPIKLTGDRLLDPQQLNLYAYARNNPLVIIDPTGQDIIYSEEQKVAASEEQKRVIKAAMTRVRAQSPTADKDFGLFDKPSGTGPNLIIQVMSDEDFDKAFKDKGNKTGEVYAVVSSDGGDVVDSSDPTKLHRNIVLTFKASTIKPGAEKSDAKAGRETLVEGVLGHEIGHAEEHVTDPEGAAQRRREDKGLDYYDRRGEIRADEKLKLITVERKKAGVTVFKENSRFKARPEKDRKKS